MIAKTFCFILIFSLGARLCSPSFAADPVSRLPRIGILTPGDVDRWNKALYQGLRDAGYVDSVTAIVDSRATGGDFGLGPKLADELVALHPDVVFASPGLLAKHVADAAARVGRRVPIVLLTWDPVAEGLVASAARPGGDITGLANVYAPESSVTKQLQLLKEMLPRLRQLAYLIDTTWQKSFSLTAKAALEEAALKVGVRITTIEVTRPDDLSRAFSEVSRARAGAMIIEVGPLFAATRSQLIEFAAKQRLPAMYWDELFSYDGGLMSYGPSVAEMERRAGGFIAKILNGAKPADIPVDYSTRFRLVVNLRTAQALGVVVPQSVLIQADEIIR